MWDSIFAGSIAAEWNTLKPRCSTQDALDALSACALQVWILGTYYTIFALFSVFPTVLEILVLLLYVQLRAPKV